MKRERWIDVAKGICILLMILGHIGVAQINQWFYSFHMIVFFLLSGYTLKKREIDQKYITNKFIRLMIPYFWTCFFIIMMDCINSIVWKNDTSIETITKIIAKDLLRGFFASGSVTTFGQIQVGTRIGAIWFLPAMFFAIIIAQYIITYIKNEKKQVLIVLSVVIIAILTRDFLWLPFSIQSGMFATMFIFVGYNLKSKNILERFKARDYSICFIIYLVGVLVGVENVSIATVRMSDYIITTIIGLSSSFVLFVIAKKVSGIKILEFIGKNSLMYLCVHLFELETMAEFYNKILQHVTLSLYERTIVLYILKVVGITVVVRLLLWFTKGKEQKNTQKTIQNQSSNIEIDILYNITILFIILGFFPMNELFRRIVYSLHISSFIFVLGYLYTSKSIKEQIVQDTKQLLLPYLCYCIIFYILNSENYNYALEIQRFIAGMSFSQKILQKYSSVGPIYILLLLFVIKTFYNGISITKKEKDVFPIVFILSVIGFFLGKYGFWLPWSIDIGLYSLIIYHIGALSKKKSVFDYIKVRPYMYFILCPIWVYMIYKGSIEWSIRNYNSYTIGVAGSIAGTCLLYQLALYLSSLPMSMIIKKTMINIRESFNILLLIHALYKLVFEQYIMNKFKLYSIGFVICLVILQVIISICIKKLICCGKNIILSIKKS